MRKFIFVFVIIEIFLTSCDKMSPNIVLMDKTTEQSISLEYQENDTTNENHYIFVYVCGEVKNPKVIKLKENARVYEALEKAGGLTKQADINGINQAEILADGQKLYIPSKKEVSMQMDNNENIHTSKGLNINTASLDELMGLPGIGEAKASSIITYRDNHNGFKTIDDIMKIEGIKQSIFNKIKDLITIN